MYEDDVIKEFYEEIKEHISKSPKITFDYPRLLQYNSRKFKPDSLRTAGKIVICTINPIGSRYFNLPKNITTY